MLTLLDQHLKVRLRRLFQSLEGFFFAMAPGSAAGERVNPCAPTAVFFLFQFRVEDVGFHGHHAFGKRGDVVSVHTASIPSWVVSSTSAVELRTGIRVL